jgi:tetratricopeptide (TPR) repeat protein
MSQLARKFDRFQNLRKYLEAGMAVTKGQPQEKLQQYYVLLEADYALHVEHDTEKALAIRKAGLGEGWENERDKAYTFAKWCLERKINLEEAERIARKTLNQVFPGRFKAMVLNTLAEICAAQGNYKEAFRVIALAVRESPENDYYEEQFERFRQLLNEQE